MRHLGASRVPYHHLSPSLAAGTTTALQRQRTRVAAPAAAAMERAGDVRKPLCDRRRYQHAVLDNGLRVVAVQDSEAVFAAACANVQAGYFDDALPGAAHLLEHMVHLGSTAFPDARDYKAFLAEHGGASNASTGMVHTRYHFTVHASGLPGALARLGAALSSPLLAAESAAREVDNVHAEYSRNTNSDARKLLQLKRSLGLPPYSGFSTGSIDTLWKEPQAAGVSVPGVLQTLWSDRYCAGSTTVAVVGPQAPEELLQHVREAFGGMPGSSSSRRSNAPRKRPLVEPDSGSDRGAAGAAAQEGVVVSATSSSSSSSSSGSELEDEEGSAAAGDAAAAAVHAKAASGPSEPGSELEACWDIAGGAAAAAAAAGQQPGAAAAAQPHWQAAAAAAAAVAGHHSRYPTDVFDPAKSAGQLVLVSPQRDLREMQLLWYIPCGAAQHSGVKPWHWAAHLLGDEVPGSIAHLLKAQGLVQSLSVGVHDEVRVGRGWQFWGVTLQLTAAGEAAAEHVVATVFRGIQVLASCTDEQLAATWHEAAALAKLKFDWRDQSEPLAAAQGAAYALHYYAPDEVLSGPALMTQLQQEPLRWFVQQLTPAAVNVFWSSKRHAAADTREPFYGARFSRQALPPAWLQRVQQYTADAGRGTTKQPATTQQQQQQQQQQEGEWQAVPGELHLPPANWAIPQDFTLRQQEGEAAAGRGAAPDDQAPTLLLEQPGLSAWHRLDTSFGLPKVHLKLHLVTPAVYTRPAAAVSARLLVAFLQDLLLPLTYPAELAGSYVGLTTGPGGLSLKCAGFQGVAQQLVVEVLRTLQGLSTEQVEARFATMAGRLQQSLTNWANNNPVAHSEYAAHHVLLEQHHHNRDLLAALATVGAADVMQLQQQLVSGDSVHVDLLCYGNISAREAADLAQRVRELSQPQGLCPGQAWPALRRVVSLRPLQHHGDGSSVSANGSSGHGSSAGPVLVKCVPDNPNPSNSNNACYYLMQVGPDNVARTAMLDLFVSMASKPAFHSLRTQQRLGYSVHLGASHLQRQLGLVLRVQSPTTTPAAVGDAIRAWLAGFRPELQALAADKLDSHKQSLTGKLLEPPKSLKEAARRAWAPLGATRTLDWRRRQSKAAALAAIDEAQLLRWYDDVVRPGGARHAALCVEVWGGDASAVPATDEQPGTLVLREGSPLQAFKRAQPLLPLPQMVLPLAAASEA